MKAATLAAIGVILLTGAITLSFAQGTPSPGKILARMDSNHDGRISRQEWRGPSQRFQRLDSDSDGFLSRDELGAVTNGKTVTAPNSQPVIDVHSHLHAHPTSSREERQNYDYSAAADGAIARMDENNVRIDIIMPTPGIRENPEAETSVIEQALRFPGRFARLGGGNALNTMIHQTPAGKVSEEIKRHFQERAEQILQHGALGFGEMAALHFSFSANHPFEESSPDHPLFLLLADIAAANDVPIDLHNELVLADMDTPAELLKRSKRNPPRVKENVKELENLLSHNRKARIVLSHSMDSTGGRKASVIRGLFERHANLFMSLNVLPGYPFLDNMPLKPRGSLAPDWMQLIKDYPDRFLIGSDQFYIAQCSGCKTADNLTWTLRWLAVLPTDIAQKIALENPKRIYKIN